MTVEHKIVVGLGDIKALIFECRKCLTRVSVPVEEAKTPHACPCGHQWLPDYMEGTSGPKLSAYQRFCSALKECRTLQANGSPFTVLLEFEAQQFEDKPMRREIPA
ncbi:MAG: hypothetical protein ABSD63_00630 [Candidatus Korobacteraceae bacterium]|jgi:hypothetical protein